MRVVTDGQPRLLTYCTNVHPAETVAGIEAALADVAAGVKRRVCPTAPFGIGLWLPRGVVDELASPARRREFARRLGDLGLFAFTLNAFPYRGFHEPRVKERVFEPAWDDPRRLAYTTDCADVLVDLMDATSPPGDPGAGAARGSISTVPLGLPTPTFDRATAIANLRAAADHLAETEARSGRRVVLALEPEPCALLGTVSEAARFLDEEVFDGRDDPRRRHLGACLDACHEAVLFQAPDAGLRALEEHGVVCGKLQVTAALRVRGPADPAVAAAIRAFDEGRYYHQAAARVDGAAKVWPDLEPFLADVEAGGAAARASEARVHFHVPVFASPEGPVGTTQEHLAALLDAVSARAGVDHLEVETYTFDVIPPARRAELGGGDLPSLLAAELGWVLDRLRRGAARAEPGGSSDGGSSEADRRGR